jgi:hypothetical protein
MMNTPHQTKAWAAGVVPVGMLVVAGIALAEALQFPESAGDIPGPALAPMLVAGALSLVAIGLLFRRGEGSDPEAPGEPWPTLGMLLAAMCGYALLMPLLGFISGTAILLAACLKIFGHPVGARGWAFGLGAAFVIWVVFDKLMRVPLPQGWIG